MRALLLIAHGSRRPEANDDLHHFAERLRQTEEFGIVQAAFLELAEPNIQQGGELCVTQGAQRVVLLPFFLSAGVHVREDLEEQRRQLALRYSEVDFRLAEPLGRHPLLEEVILQRAQEAL